MRMINVVIGNMVSTVEISAPKREGETWLLLRIQVWRGCAWSRMAPLSLATCRAKGKWETHEQRTGSSMEFFRGMILGERHRDVRFIHEPFRGAPRISVRRSWPPICVVFDHGSNANTRPHFHGRDGIIGKIIDKWGDVSTWADVESMRYIGEKKKEKKSRGKNKSRVRTCRVRIKCPRCKSSDVVVS